MGLRSWIYKKTGINLKKNTICPQLTELTLKNFNLKNQKNIKTLGIGSSHGAYAFDASLIDNSYNLCSNSQDLYYSYQLYKQINERHNELKNVILFFSVFSSGFDLSMCNDKKIAAYFKYIYDIKPQNNEDEINYIAKSCKINKIKAQKFKNGFICSNEFLASDYMSVKNRADSHIKHGNRKNNQLSFLIKIADACKKNNQALTVLIAPARNDYKKQIPPDYFDNIYSIRNEINFNIIDLFNSNKFNDDDFGDSDHVNNKGAIKLTKILKESFI